MIFYVREELPPSFGYCAVVFEVRVVMVFVMLSNMFRCFEALLSSQAPAGGWPYADIDEAAKGLGL